MNRVFSGLVIAITMNCIVDVGSQLSSFLATGGGVGVQQPEHCARVLCRENRDCNVEETYIPLGQCCPVCRGTLGVIVGPPPVMPTGTCPPPSPGLCISNCRAFSDCTGGQLCCPTQCGASVCRAPMGSALASAALPPGFLHPGILHPALLHPAMRLTSTCPRPLGIPTHCFSLCNMYRPCFGNHICCSNGCGRQCMAPVASGSIAAATQQGCFVGGRLVGEGQIVACQGPTKQVCRGGTIVPEPTGCPPPRCMYPQVNQQTCCATCPSWNPWGKR